VKVGQPSDSVLVAAFGGPSGPADVEPFLANVLRGRRVLPQRWAEVVAKYMRFGGISPLTDITRRQAALLQERLAAMGRPMPVVVGMRHWHPFLADSLRQMSEAGLRRPIVFIAAPHRSPSSDAHYQEAIRNAQQQLVDAGRPSMDVAYVSSWFDHPLFIETIICHIREAIAKLPIELQSSACIVFTAHSLPIAEARSSSYVEQLMTTAQLVMDRLAIGCLDSCDDEKNCSQNGLRNGPREWALVYQSRSGSPEEPWLEPDISDYLRAQAKAIHAAVIVPIGFCCDHIEVLYDLDVQIGDLCQLLGIPMVRAATPGDNPRFIDMMADVVLRAGE